MTRASAEAFVARVRTHLDDDTYGAFVHALREFLVSGDAARTATTVSLLLGDRADLVGDFSRLVKVSPGAALNVGDVKAFGAGAGARPQAVQTAAGDDTARQETAFHAPDSPTLCDQDDLGLRGHDRCRPDEHVDEAVADMNARGAALFIARAREHLRRPGAYEELLQELRAYALGAEGRDTLEIRVRALLSDHEDLLEDFSRFLPRRSEVPVRAPALRPAIDSWGVVVGSVAAAILTPLLATSMGLFTTGAH